MTDQNLEGQPPVVEHLLDDVQSTGLISAQQRILYESSFLRLGQNCTQADSVDRVTAVFSVMSEANDLKEFDL